jgi:beta-ribofuranosylaminobenzene 5'-phosphate synthase
MMTGRSSVEILAPARLHLGFLDLEGGTGRRFGSLGLALDGLATRLSMGPAASDRFLGCEADRAGHLLGRLRECLSIPPVAIEIPEAIPAHIGLGSGTQLGLALGIAACRIAGLEANAGQIGAILERGARSGIGIGAFEGGGVLLDGGRGPEGSPPPIIGRVPFPETWRVLLIRDLTRRGLSGEAERVAFARLPAFAPEQAGRLCRLAVMAFLPAVATADLASAGRAINEIQRRVGDHFAPAQGARFTSPAVARALAWLEKRGVEGVGQSSWGPTGFALLGDEASGQSLRSELDGRFPDLAFDLLRGRNRGADIRMG